MFDLFRISSRPVAFFFRSFFLRLRVFAADSLSFPFFRYHLQSIFRRFTLSSLFFSPRPSVNLHLFLSVPVRGTLPRNLPLLFHEFVPPRPIAFSCLYSPDSLRPPKVLAVKTFVVSPPWDAWTTHSRCLEFPEVMRRTTREIQMRNIFLTDILPLSTLRGENTGSIKASPHSSLLDAFPLVFVPNS